VDKRKVESIGALLAEHFAFAGATVVDVGCGTGALVRWLVGQGAVVTGIDTTAMIAKAGSNLSAAGQERYLAGSAEALPLPDRFADLVIYAASLHHVPADRFRDALRECARVLKEDGKAAFVEPVAQPDSYYQITRLVEEEADLQRSAYRAILEAGELGLCSILEEYVYMERSFRDFQDAVATFVEDERRRPAIVAAAHAITTDRAAAAGVAFDDFRYRSTCRLNVLRKSCQMEVAPGLG
jgi:ubiquinone/menaquinone biosynthesis C-methylase UbiE